MKFDVYNCRFRSSSAPSFGSSAERAPSLIARARSSRACASLRLGLSSSARAISASSCASPNARHHSADTAGCAASPVSPSDAASRILACDGGTPERSAQPASASAIDSAPTGSSRAASRRGLRLFFIWFSRCRQCLRVLQHAQQIALERQPFVTREAGEAGILDARQHLGNLLRRLAPLRRELQADHAAVLG